MTKTSNTTPLTMWSSRMTEQEQELRAALYEARKEIERLREIIRRMDGLTDDAQSALAIVRQAVREELDE